MVETVKLDKYRQIVCFSFCFLTFFGGNLYITKEFCNFVTLKQQKIKERRSYFDEWNYQEVWDDWLYKWKTIKIS